MCVLKKNFHDFFWTTSNLFIIWPYLIEKKKKKPVCFVLFFFQFRQEPITGSGSRI